jgi:hypothetical protein
VDFNGSIAKAAVQPGMGLSVEAIILLTSFRKHMNLRNEYFGAAKGSDIRVLMLSRVLLGNYLSMDNASAQERTAQRTAHNLELTGSAQQHHLNTGNYARVGAYDS